MAVAALLTPIAAVAAPGPADTLDAEVPGVLIDDFRTDQDPLSLTFPPAGTSRSSYANGQGITHQERDMQVDLTAGVVAGNAISAVVSSDVLRYSQDATISGSATVTWDAVDNSTDVSPDGMDYYDLAVDGSINAFVLDVVFDDLPVDVTFTVTTDAANGSSATLSLPGSVSTPRRFAVPFAAFTAISGTGANFADIGSVQMRIGSSTTAPVVVIDSLSTQSVVVASMTAALTLDVNGDTVVDVGDRLTYTTVITNIDDPFDYASDATAFTLAPPAGASLLTGSVTTSMGTVTSGNTVGDATAAVDIGPIDDGASATVAVTVEVSPGAASPLSAQGAVTTGSLTVLTDDPGYPGTADPTETVVDTRAPTISDIADVTIDEDTSTSVVSFTVGHPDTDPATLTLDTASTNTAIMPVAGIVLGGSGTTRTIQLTPAANQSGTSTIQVTVSDGGFSATDSFVLTVVPQADPGRYNPLSPARILDTRNGAGGIAGPVGTAATIDVQVAGAGGVPASGATAVAMNVTVTGPSAPGSLTVYPAGAAVPSLASIVFGSGQTVPNLVVVPLGTGGKVSMFNGAGSTQVIADVAGWYGDGDVGPSAQPGPGATPGPGPGLGNEGRYTALIPSRVLDTRSGGGVRLTAGASMNVQVAGAGGVPASGVSAAVLNVAATGPTASSYLTVYPTGEAQPPTANLNFVAGQTVSNRTVAKLGAGGRITIYNNKGSADIIVDVGGWFSDTSVPSTSGVTTPLVPARILDSGALAANSTTAVQVTGVGGVPASGVRAVILDATVTGPAAAGWLTVFPTGSTKPTTSDLNYASGQPRSNLVVAKLGAGGKVSLFTSAGARVTFDVVGWVS